MKIEEIKKEFENKLRKRITEWFANIALDDLGGKELRIRLVNQIVSYSVKKLESTISQTRQEVIEEIDKLQKQCSEADGMVDGMTALHTLREKLLEDLNKK